ncbi:SET domain-containing protein [Exidia glandulosa HHB12029]|uniref:SET domain-containing protein n=1 Tax=Exidia glandulosa HHB12029 TaxID=1314781 RepID=A0A165K4Y8_EXIGL|nr:SET domain-containing protein [Exidia glandulosa HHB12029]
MLHIKYTLSRGRGVYASASIEPNTVVERSPVLLFSKEEYAAYGKHTLLDHYTFNWPDGRMALALGLGSLFNHSSRPNTSFSIKPHEDEPTIEYTVLRRVEPGEELCIFYAHSLWFTPDDPNDAPPAALTEEDDPPFDLLRISVDEEPEDTVETSA